MKRACLAILVCCLAAGVAAAQETECRPRRHGKIPAIKDLTYHKARKRLLAAGWRPLKTKFATGPDADPNLTNGNAPAFLRRGYVEVESCAGTGWAACAFLFKDAYGNRLRVNTMGEELTRPRSYAHVNAFRFICD